MSQSQPAQLDHIQSFSRGLMGQSNQRTSYVFTNYLVFHLTNLNPGAVSVSSSKKATTTLASLEERSSSSAGQDSSLGGESQAENSQSKSRFGKLLKFSGGIRRSLKGGVSQLKGGVAALKKGITKEKLPQPRQPLSLEEFSAQEVSSVTEASIPPQRSISVVS